MKRTKGKIEPRVWPWLADPPGRRALASAAIVAASMAPLMSLHGARRPCLCKPCRTRREKAAA